MTVIEWLELFGIPAIIMSIIGMMFRYLHSRFKETNERSKAIELGVQALLRAQMIADYNKWVELEFAPIYARENFENCWKQYEALGENGVMNDLHAKFMALPTNKPGKENKEV